MYYKDWKLGNITYVHISWDKYYYRYLKIYNRNNLIGVYYFMACVQLNVFWDGLSMAFLRYFLPGSSPVAHIAVVEYGEYLLKVYISYVIAYRNMSLFP